MTPWTNTTAVHLERQLRNGLAALEAAASLEERQAQVMQLRVMATPANIAALLRLLDEARAAPRAEEHTLPVAGPASRTLDYGPLYEFAQENHVSYNELCALVEALV